MDPVSLITTFLLVSLVFIPLERLYALKPQQRVFRSGWQVDLCHVMFTGIMLQATHVAVIVSVVSFISSLIPTSFHFMIQLQPLWLQYLEILVIADLGFYVMHRAFHSIGRLWQLHEVHHSSQQLDFLAAYRVHPIDQFMVRSVTLIPVFVLGFDATALLLFAVIYHWHGMLLHSNTKFRFGWLERIVATPAYHHWHHAKGAVQTCNFAGQLALIDVIFGTYRESRTNRPDEYGIDAEMPGNYLGQLISPFRQRHSRPQITQQASTS